MKPIYEERKGAPERIVNSGEYCESKDCEYRGEDKNCRHLNAKFEKAWSSHDILPFLTCKSYRKVS